MRAFTIAVLAATLLASACIDDAADKPTGSAEGAAAASADVTTDSANFTSIQWIDSIRNMGSIREGQKLEVTFRFKNIGSKPLVIQSATPSCGCTVPEKPEKPVMPGEESMIKAVFDSQGRQGTNHKTINVVANTKGTTNHSLEFNVEVVGEKEGPKATSGSPSQF
ncbi:MAG TPA: DUF1573 domain-containing protein [Phnomibacter sp.]|nr:DUF1573 domain-containing protein [Phnomibacter sp.]